MTISGRDSLAIPASVTDVQARTKTRCAPQHITKRDDSWQADELALQQRMGTGRKFQYRWWCRDGLSPVMACLVMTPCSNHAESVGSCSYDAWIDGDRAWSWWLVSMLPINWLTYPYLPWVPWKPWRIAFDDLPPPHALGTDVIKVLHPPQVFTPRALGHSRLAQASICGWRCTCADLTATTVARSWTRGQLESADSASLELFILTLRRRQGQRA